MSLKNSARVPTPVVAGRAEHVAEPGLPVEGEFAETLGPSANVRDIRFEPGTRFKLGELTVELLHCLSLHRVVISDPTTGEARVVARAELKPLEKGVNAEAARPPELNDVSEEAFAKGAAREDALRPYITAGVMSDREAHRLGRTLGVSGRTVWRWMKRYKQCGDITAFLDAPPGVRQGRHSLDPEVDAIIHFAVSQKLCLSGNCSVRAVYNTIESDCTAIGRAVPARSTVLDRIKALKADPDKLPANIAGRAGERKRLVRGSAEAVRALQRVEIDHTLVDTHVVDAVDGGPLGRPWLTIAIDVATRVVLGFTLTLEHPSRLSVALCVRHAVFPKESWLQSLGAAGPWPMFGRMELIYTDNGAEFRSLSFRLGCRRQGIQYAYRPVRTPRYGGTVERLIGTFMRRMRLIPGNTYNEILETRTPHAAQQAVLTLDDLDRWFCNEVTAYHNERHRTLGISPAIAWERAWQSENGLVLPRYPADSQAFFIDLLPHQSRVITREGINLYGLRYHCLELEPYVHPEMRRIVRIDPRDVSSVFLERPEGGHLRVPWINQNWPRLSLWEWNEIHPRDRKRGNVADPEIVRQCLADNDRLIAERAAQGKLRARRRRARAGRWGAELGLDRSGSDKKPTADPHSADPIPALPRTQLEVAVASVDSPVSFEVLE
jgi:putative transposase